MHNLFNVKYFFFEWYEIIFFYYERDKFVGRWKHILLLLQGLYSKETKCVTFVNTLERDPCFRSIKRLNLNNPLPSWSECVYMQNEKYKKFFNKQQN